MGDFFNGWRRKAGGLTLVVACLFAAGWVRSFVVFDKFCHCRHGISHTHLYSVKGQVWGSRLFEEDGELICHWHYSSKSDNVIICRLDEIIWRWTVGEFEFGEFPVIGIGRATYGIIPYWSIVLPLTLLSAYLLLSNPRKTKSVASGI